MSTPDYSNDVTFLNSVAEYCANDDPADSTRLRLRAIADRIRETERKVAESVTSGDYEYRYNADANVFEYRHVNEDEPNPWRVSCMPTALPTALVRLLPAAAARAPKE